LHRHGVTHLDIKPENVVISSNFDLRIIDFDFSRISNSDENLAMPRGTKDYRAPELISGNIFNFEACDVFSLGVVLFVIKTGGKMPFLEDHAGAGIPNLVKLIEENPEEFWNFHSKILGLGNGFFSKEFRNFFEKVCNPNPT